VAPLAHTMCLIHTDLRFGRPTAFGVGQHGIMLISKEMHPGTPARVMHRNVHTAEAKTHQWDTLQLAQCIQDARVEQLLWRHVQQLCVDSMKRAQNQDSSLNKSNISFIVVRLADSC
jgi:hypothetical protein